jgi:ketosteroid isomerase-like protein
MSQERVEIIRAVYERFSEGDFRASAELLDPHVVLVLGPQFAPNLLASSPVAGAFYGVEAVATYTRSFLEDQTVTMEAEEIDLVGDSVVVGVRQRAVGKASGVPTKLRYFTVWSFRGGKVIRIESFTARAEALEAAGLQE